MKGVIVEDELLIADQLKRILERAGHQVLCIVESFDEIDEAIFPEADFYLLDINLTQLKSGIELGVELNKREIPFIYITASTEIETMRKAILSSPETYISKPFNQQDVIAALLILESKKEKESVNILTPKGRQKILLDDILFLKADNVYVEIHTENQVFTERKTLKEMEDLLNKDFIKVHRSYLVNKNKVNSHSSQMIFIQNHQIPVSRSFKVGLDKL